VLASILVLLAGCAPGASPSPDTSPTPVPIPEASFTGGTASAHLALPTTTAWDGGWCERGPDDAWLAVSIGSPNGPEYFGLVVGRSAYTPQATRAAAGGGRFGAEEAVVTWRHAEAAANLAGSDLVVEVATDLASGTFTGRRVDGTPVQGTFSCRAAPG